MGDTFDYRITETGQDASTFPPIQSNYTQYIRIVITDVQNLQLHDSISIGEDVYATANPPFFSNTFTFVGHKNLIIDSSNNSSVFDAKNYCGYPLCAVAADTGYGHRIVNLAIICGGLGCDIDTFIFADGLGVTYAHTGGGDGEGTWSYVDTILIYYSQSGENWGIPATIAVGIPDVSIQASLASLFPNINSGEFTVKINNDNILDYQLIVYDLTGRETFRTILNNNTSHVHIPNVSPGMYTWRIINQGNILQCGKMIIT